MSSSSSSAAASSTDDDSDMEEKFARAAQETKSRRMSDAATATAPTGGDLVLQERLAQTDYALAIQNRRLQRQQAQVQEAHSSGDEDDEAPVVVEPKVNNTAPDILELSSSSDDEVRVETKRPKTRSNNNTATRRIVPERQALALAHQQARLNSPPNVSRTRLSSSSCIELDQDDTISYLNVQVELTLERWGSDPQVQTIRLPPLSDQESLHAVEQHVVDQLRKQKVISSTASPKILFSHQERPLTYKARPLSSFPWANDNNSVITLQAMTCLSDLIEKQQQPKRNDEKQFGAVVLLQLRQNADVVTVRCRQRQPFSHLLEVYRKQRQLPNQTMVLEFDGQVLSLSATPEQLDMEHDDLIEVKFK
jgi:Ubiquitin-2 like Rad60 SUMO-like